LPCAELASGASQQDITPPISGGNHYEITSLSFQQEKETPARHCPGEKAVRHCRGASLAPRYRFLGGATLKIVTKGTHCTHLSCLFGKNNEL
jgi:hypothetical protein